MGKSSSQKQAEQNDLQIQTQQIAAQQQANQIAQQQASAQQQQQSNTISLQQQYQNMVSPFAQQALGVGQQALNGQVPQGLANALMAGPRQQLSADYAQAGNNLTEALGRQGIAGTGLSAGPIASMYAKQAGDTANLTQNANLQALNMGISSGFQGANVAGNQQALGFQMPGVYNPTGFMGASNNAAQTGTMNPQQFAGFNWAGLFGGLGAAAGGALTGGLSAGGAFNKPAGQ